MRRLLLLSCAGSALFGCGNPQGPGPFANRSQNYGPVTVSAPTLIGPGVATSVNKEGEIVGQASATTTFEWLPTTGTAQTFPFAGSHPAIHPKDESVVAGGMLRNSVGTLFTFNVPGGFTAVDGIALNAAGTVVGNATGAGVTSRPMFWKPAGGTHLLPVIAPLTGQKLVFAASGMNDSGDVVGSEFIDNTAINADSFYVGALWPAAGGPPQMIGGDLRFTSINNCREKSGSLQVTGADAAALFFVNNDVRRLSKELPSGFGAPSSAAALDNIGWVAGSAFASGRSHAFLWRPDGGPALELPPLTGDDAAAAAAVNDSGVVVGYSENSASGARQAVSWSVPSVTFAGTVTMYSFLITELQKTGALTSAEAGSLIAFLNLATSEAGFGHRANARAALASFAATASALGNAGSLEATRAHLLSDGATCLGTVL